MAVKKNEKANIYEIVTDSIIKSLENGVVPWQKPWKSSIKGVNAPINMVSKKEYRGINFFILSNMMEVNRWDKPLFLTYKQAQDLGGSIKKGEKAIPVTFWKVFNKTNKTEDDDSGDDKGFLLRYYNVFNIDQCEGIDLTKFEKNKELDEEKRIEIAESVIKEMPNAPVITFGGNRAFYRPSEDSVTLPNYANFKSPEGYYETMFHELGHSTGHEKRLGRKGITERTYFGSSDYSEEELVAEFTASYLMNHCGLFNKTKKNSAAYIQSWLKVLEGNRKMLVNCASKAQKACDYILGKKVAA